MISFLRKIRYPHVAATLALVLAMSGGVVYAAKKIGTKSLKNNAVTSKKIKDGQVALNDLAPDAKPSAAVSLPAPGTPGGAGKAIDYSAAPGSGQKTLFSGSGVTLTGNCAAGPDGTYGISGPGSFEVQWTIFNSPPSDGANLSAGESSNYSRGGPALGDLFASDDGIADGELVYDVNGRATPGGQIVVITFHAEEADGVCRMQGDARISSP